MERFDQEREGFVAQRGLDTSRPLAKQPIDWKYVTFDEALELGRKTGKPVFIDVMAFWCVWCYRMDYYTYPDAEVAALLGGDFVPVKIIQEQDRAGDYDRLMKEKLEARGIPAMGVFRADGSVVHKIGGWKKPEEFIAELKAAKAAFAGN
jgi:thiol:disulfide interchange protein